MIDKSKIKTGDLLLFRIVPDSNLLGKLIGWFSVLTGNGGTYAKTYGHVAICENSDTYIEMTFPHSRRTVIDQRNPEMEVWRIKDATEDQLKAAVKWAVENMGKWYNVRHIIGLGFIKGYGCADFVFNCFNETHTGILLDKKGTKDPVCSPNEIVDSGLVICIDNGGHTS
jgi:uncharacterized protein YycO